MLDFKKMPYLTGDSLTYEVEFNGNFVGMFFIEENGDGVDTLELYCYDLGDFKELVLHLLEQNNITYEVTKFGGNNYIKLYNTYNHEKRDTIYKHLGVLAIQNKNRLSIDLINFYRNKL